MPTSRSAFSRPPIGVLMGVLSIAFAFGATGGTAHASGTPICAQTGAEAVITDEPSYPSGSTVHISGTGYAPDCYVIVQVVRPDGSVVTGDGTNTPGSDTAVADAEGNLVYDYIAQDVAGVYQVNVVGADNVVLASTTFVDAAKVNTLRVGNSVGPEDYVFVAGNVVYAEGQVDSNKYYKWIVRDPSGNAVQTTTCPAIPTTGAVSNSYTIKSTDPVSNASLWTYELHQFSSS